MAEHRRQKKQTRDGVASETLKRHCTKSESITGIRNQGWRQQLRLRKERTAGSGIRELSRRQEPHLRSKETLYEAHGQTHELEYAKQIIGISIRL
jgi:hypothetical protein